ncbi:glycosyltransferase family 1 protein [Neorhizobium sp. JUb45]|uniref:glycosyltransferase family 4 protein n=1 Tax=Neorhizobium sp. JUb45 TaxID=2485113 RepID=UPI00104FF1D6|nr:glycosyltransferase family 1 protein [Neorhizobium sp. JUb45]TCR03924.1 glycosyltransferase involved in cell wall biosynthesis [Neorhizobium sp. JUb45]
MKIGVDARNLVPSLSGIGRYVLETCRELGERGHCLILYMPEKPRKPLPLLRNCEIRTFDFRGPLRRAIWSMTALPKAANDDNLDVFWGPAHRLPLGLSKQIPSVVTIHDLVWQKAPATMRWQTWVGERLFMRSALKRATIIVADSQATAADVVAFYQDASSRISVVYPGLTQLSVDAVHAEAPIGCSTCHPYALFVGTLEPRKNLQRLLQAFAALPTANRGALNLVIAGGQGWRMGDLTKMIDQYNLKDIVKLTGYVSDTQLASLYASARFLLMPSLYEGFGLPIIEAQSFGIPVITSTTSSMPEVAARGALLIDPLNVTELARAIVRLNSDNELRQVLSSYAKENACRFSWQKTGQQLSLIFQIAGDHMSPSS